MTKLSFFHDAPNGLIRELAYEFLVNCYQDSDTLFVTGEMPNRLYIVIEGSVVLIDNSPSDEIVTSKNANLFVDKKSNSIQKQHTAIEGDGKNKSKVR